MHPAITPHLSQPKNSLSRFILLSRPQSKLPTAAATPSRAPSLAAPSPSRHLPLPIPPPAEPHPSTPQRPQPDASSRRSPSPEQHPPLLHSLFLLLQPNTFPATLQPVSSSCSSRSGSHSLQRLFPSHSSSPARLSLSPDPSRARSSQPTRSHSYSSLRLPTRPAPAAPSFFRLPRLPSRTKLPCLHSAFLPAAVARFFLPQPDNTNSPFTSFIRSLPFSSSQLSRKILLSLSRKPIYQK